VVSSDATPGGSIAVNGVCLTVVDHRLGTVSFDVMAETLNRSSLGALEVGHPVNLERAMAATDRLGGHIVQGHIDARGEVIRIEPEGDGRLIQVGARSDGLRYIVEKGSITVDGVSLTVASVDATGFEVALIPHTISTTTLGWRRPGDVVNLEFDVLAKYVERLLERHP